MATTIQYVFANFFESELVAGLTASSTTMMISPGDAAKLPIIAAGSNTQAMLTIWDGQLPPEIVAVTTNDQSGTMTIARAQESTVPQAWASGTQVRCSLTAAIINAALAAYFDINTILQAHFLALTGGTLTGPLILPADPTLAQQAATKHYVDSVQGAGLPITGGTMQGPINMSGAKILNLADPGSPQDAATKNYVDTVDALLAPKASPTFTGTPAAPTATSGNNSTQLATTAYVDGAVGGIGGAWGAGDVKLTFKNVADPGWLMMDDLLIGKTASTADHKNDLYTNLFQLLYNNIPDTWCPVFATKGGAGNVRTGNALNDFNAGFVLTLPRTLGRALAIAGTGAGLTGRALGQFLGEETHVLTAPESVPHRHIVVVQVPDVAISDAQVQPVPNGPTNGLAEGDFTGASLARSGVWAANSFGTTGPRLYDAASTADRTGNGLTLNDSVYLGNAGGTPPGSDVARGHNNMSPESFLNVMIKY